jgi:Flp pilus assembly pilin Flp
MKFFKLFKKFHNEDDGAVTVDWVVLTAAVVGLAFAALSAVRTSTGGLTTKISNYMSSLELTTTF